MRIEFKMEGGIAHFPGLSRPVTIDSDTLPGPEADTLRRLVDAAHVFDLPAVAGTPAPGAADYYRYTVTIEDEGRRHTVQATEPVEDPALRELLGFLRSKARALRTETR
ncbi:MAG: protealysin inhibitor emfourin [Candidatus Entotheonellia bacterium]